MLYGFSGPFGQKERNWNKNATTKRAFWRKREVTWSLPFLVKRTITQMISLRKKRSLRRFDRTDSLFASNEKVFLLSLIVLFLEKTSFSEQNRLLCLLVLFLQENKRCSKRRNDWTFDSLEWHHWIPCHLESVIQEMILFSQNKFRSWKDRLLEPWRCYLWQKRLMSWFILITERLSRVIRIKNENDHQCWSKWDDGSESRNGKRRRRIKNLYDLKTCS